ncbi:MAG TPA: glycyl-radical enzyme activating protein [Spirochaetia bacterium]|nr:glycyl-radical enzyme activating protein [Spirochaetia bacterium]
MTGTIIDIKRFTLHDGQGIRSTLFLKGCGLRCAWCQNPEGLDPALRLWYLPTQCIRCGLCEASCPEGAISLSADADPYVQIDRELCTTCGACVTACPTTALSFDGSKVSAEEAAETLLRDVEFYRESGGGITISGGDPLVQHEFALEVLGLCRRAGVHTAIETCLFGDWEVIERFIPLTDLFIIDLKIADSALHAEYTDRPNDLILDNYAKLARTGAALLTRVPLIPGITATEANIGALARFIRDKNPGGAVELLNFNPLAINKYSLMNRSTELFNGMAPLADGQVETLRRVLETEGLAVLREHKRSDRPGK